MTLEYDFIYFSKSTFVVFFFFFNDTATTEIYTLSLQDALPICVDSIPVLRPAGHYRAMKETVGAHAVRHDDERGPLRVGIALESPAKRANGVVVGNADVLRQLIGPLDQRWVEFESDGADPSRALLGRPGSGHRVDICRSVSRCGRAKGHQPVGPGW